MLQTQNQLDQLFLAQALQITSAHCAMDSDFLDPGKRAITDYESAKRPNPKSAFANLGTSVLELLSPKYLSKCVPRPIDRHTGSRQNDIVIGS